MKRRNAVLRAVIALGAPLLLWHPVSAGEIADATMRGDTAAFERLLAARADVNAPQADGATALHWAVYRNEPDLVRTLLAAGAEITATNSSGVAPLLLAAESGNLEILELLLDAGASFNTTLRNGETALMMAARTGNVAALELLLERGAPIDAREPLRGTTALMWAAAYRHAAAVSTLLANGADFSLRSSATARGRRPYLAPSGRERIAQVARGVDVSGTAHAPASAPPADEADTPPQPQAQRDWGGLTALAFATREGDAEIARILLEAGADVNQTTEFGWTPLLIATQNRYYRLGQFFLDHGADVNLSNKGGWNPLYIATDNRNIEGGDYPTRKPDIDHLEFIKLLLAHGANPDTRMHSSTETRTVFTHQWLYDNGVTPLMVAVGIGWVEGVTYEWSPEQTRETVALLLELGAEVNAQDGAEGRTALMGAAHKGRTQIIELLVEHGANLAARDVGSRDSIYALAGVTWQAIDYADGLVRVGVQSAIAHPEAAALLRGYMREAGLPVPPADRTLASICITDLCR